MNARAPDLPRGDPSRSGRVGCRRPGRTARHPGPATQRAPTPRRTLDILASPFAGSSLVRNYLSGDDRVSTFYPSGHPGELDAYRARASEVDARFTTDDRRRLAGALRGGGPDATMRLARFVEADGLAVTTGQQPGLFGGPLFTIYKAATAAALARRLEARLERPVIPVFWVASEDHDWEEVRRIHLPDLHNDLAAIEVPIPPGSEEAPLHRIPMGGELDQATGRLLEILPETDFSGPWVPVLRSAYREGRTLPEAFAELLEALLGPAGVFVLSPEHPELQKAALPVLLEEAARAREVGETLAARAAELEAAGYHVQVPVLEGGVNLFFEGARGRDRVFLDDGTFRLRRSGERLDAGELRARAEDDPIRLSPNVLLRPVVESVLVPTLSYVAGPGETAYFAQTGPVFAAHGMGPPVVHPRFSGTVLERKIAKVLDKFGLGVEAVARPHHELASDLAREEIPESVRRALAELRGATARGTAALAAAIKDVDPTLAGPVEHSRSQTFAHLDDVERKVTQALKRQNEVSLAQLDKARLHLFPLGKPQERVISPFYYIFRYGSELLDRWMTEAEEALLLPDR